MTAIAVEGWNGDGVPINGSVSSMLDEAVHDFRPFVHSDCGAGETSGTAVMRWTAHCVLGTILRYHGVDHSPWLFDNATQAVIRRCVPEWCFSVVHKPNRFLYE